MSNAFVNVASHLKAAAQERPYHRAVVYPAGRDPSGRAAYAHLTFRQLDKESDCLAHGLEAVGIGRGKRTILMVPQGPVFFSMIFAMFKIGAVPVVVDPGMGVRRMLDCLWESRPEGFVGISKAHVLRVLFPKYFRTVTAWVTAGRRWFWGGPTLGHIRRLPWRPFTPAPTHADETAAILFTTGSTGPAKGAVYTHGNFEAQLNQIRRHLELAPDEIDLSTFPLFALFYPALGITAVLPDMDPTRPAQVDPSKIIEAIVDQGVTNMFASPALLNRVGAYGKARAVRLPSLKRVISAGAPVAPAIVDQFTALLADDAQVHTPYGATEAVPVISIASHEILSETRRLTEMGYGYCIGRPIGDVAVRVIRISDDPIARWTDDLVLEDGEVGEIVVQGDLVTRRYFDRPEADALAKIADGDGFWHRMGDLGWLDKKGRFWFCGRKSHRVITEKGTLYTIPCEAVFNTHPLVYRTALVGVGNLPAREPVLCVETAPDRGPVDLEAVRADLLTLGSRNPLTEDIHTILFHKAFPVDIRHNAKIFREQLALWAEKRLAGKTPVPTARPEPPPEPSREAQHEAPREADSGAESWKEPGPGAEPQKDPDPGVEPRKDPDPCAEPQKDPDPGAEPRKDPDLGVEPRKDPDPGVEPRKDPDPGAEPQKDPDPGAEPRKDPDPGVEPQKDLDPGAEPRKDPPDERA